MAAPLAGRANFESVLVYYDEPQVMLLNRSDDRKLIAVAIPHEGLAISGLQETTFPFFAAEISWSQTERYFRGVNDLRYLFMYPKHKKWYLFDFSLLDSRDRVPLVPVPSGAIRSEWFPDAGFFVREHTETFEISREGLQLKTFFIDGSWDFADFSRFYGKFAEIYSLYLAIFKFNSADATGEAKRIIKTAFVHYPFMGGSSYRNFYGDLLNAQTYSDRLSVNKIEYASPGHVEVYAQADIFGKVRKSLDHFGSNQFEAAGSYKRLRDFLGKSHLLRSNAAEFNSDSEMGRIISRMTLELSAAMSFEEISLVNSLVEQNALAAAKVVLSYARRIERSYMFFAEGRVSWNR